MSKSLLSLLLCFGLTACASMNQQAPTVSGAEADEEKPLVTDNLDDQSVHNTTEINDMDDTSLDTDFQESQPLTPIVTIDDDVVSPKPVSPKPTPQPLKTEEGKLILGQQEWVHILGLEKTFTAHILPEAITSSVHALDIVPFEREGKEWVTFKIEHSGALSSDISLPILRWATLTRSKAKQDNDVNNTSDKKTVTVIKRPVVTAWIQVGELKEKANFILTDNKSDSYPLVLGQQFLRDVAVVDTTKSFIQPKM